jgi:GMP synthase-like glutamine amidotransferase
MLSFIRNDVVQDFDSIANNLDCLILTGGDDSALRRVTEIKIAKLMLQLSFIGICHGAFLLTDLMGGTITDVTTHMDMSR